MAVAQTMHRHGSDRAGPPPCCHGAGFGDAQVAGSRAGVHDAVERVRQHLRDQGARLPRRRIDCNHDRGDEAHQTLDRGEELLVVLGQDLAGIQRAFVEPLRAPVVLVVLVVSLFGRVDPRGIVRRERTSAGNHVFEAHGPEG
ncbi:hypothetical protein D7X74_04215 [Corallococcus sp. CA047B]|nr:hypothetical protein D7X74_04215 [Corallococcus sp. CA047B]